MFPNAGYADCHLYVCREDPVDIDAFLLLPARGPGGRRRGAPAFCGCERLALAAFLEPAALAVAPLAVAGCCPERLVFASSRGLPPFCRRGRLAVTFRAFATYRAATLPRALPSFRQRSISYALPSSPNVLVLTSFVSLHTSQVSFTRVTVAIVLFPTGQSVS